MTDFNVSRMVKAGSTNASVTSLLANNPRWLAPEVDSFVATHVVDDHAVLWGVMRSRLVTHGSDRLAQSH